MATVTIYLPKNTKATVGSGDIVMVGLPLIGGGEEENIQYNLVTLLGIRASKIGKVVKHKVGEELQKDDIIAEKGGLFGTKSVKATFACKIIRVDPLSGVVEVAPLYKDAVSVVSPVSGTVKRMSDTEIQIDFKGSVFFAKQGIGSIRQGKLIVISPTADQMALSDIKEEHKGAILLGGHVSRNVLEKAFGLGVSSVVATELDEGDFLYFEGREIFHASILLISKADAQSLAKYGGKDAVVEGIHKRIIIQE